ncbi:MAG: hypothetical protein GY868_07395 [Deltaproteobacteria bacterium]|nr:hypothetical protein [Deltaproteobacteria bacterium]
MQPQPNKQQGLKKLTAAGRTEMRFIIRFILFFALCQGICLGMNRLAPLAANRLQARAGVLLVNTITPGEQAWVREQVIHSAGHAMAVNLGCDGMGPLMLVIAALLAFPLGRYERAFGILLSLPVVLGANLGRIVSLYYILKYRPQLFDTAHIFVGQTAIILIGLLYFLAWTRIAERLPWHRCPPG